MAQELARLCGQPLLRIQNDIKRDFYLSAAEAVSYGLIDEVLKPHQVVIFFSPLFFVIFAALSLLGSIYLEYRLVDCEKITESYHLCSFTPCHSLAD